MSMPPRSLGAANLKRSNTVTKLGDALRRKFRNPREALLALGLDPSLIADGQVGADMIVGDSRRGMASDDELSDHQAEQSERDRAAKLGKVMELLKNSLAQLDGNARSEVYQLLEQLAGSKPAQDAEQPRKISPDQADAIVAYLAPKLSAADMASTASVVDGSVDPTIPRRPYGTRIAQDAAASKSFNERFPGAAQIGVDMYMTPSTRPAPKAAAAKSYSERFPDAAKIRVAW
jgi:hypothetical protein